jgi:hypothetical protein
MKRWSPLALLVAASLVTPAAADSPKEKIKLFNGKDLTNFYTYLQDFGKNNDPKKVFTVADGMIRVSGEVWGCFTTEKEYENYHLVVEFKWGQKTYAPREKAARDSGVLLHGVGEDGAAGGSWLESIECQMIEGGTGDLILVKGKGPTPTVNATVEYRGEKSKQPYFNPDYKPVKITSRVNWYGHDPAWKDVLGFRGKQDVENKVGEWNTLECICEGDNITIVLNGRIVNKCTGASLSRGKILFQSEGAEVFFRRIDLWPIMTKK